MDSLANNNADVVVKVSFNGDLRRFPFPKGAPFKALYDQVTAILGLESGAELALKYADEDGDLITIASDWELNSAIKPGQLLRLTASVKGVAPTAPPHDGGVPFPGGPFGGPPHPHHAGPFGGPPPHAGSFGGPHHQPQDGPFGGPPHGGPHHDGPFGGPPPHGGPFGGPHHPHRGGPFGAPFQPFAGGCGGWGKGRFSPEEWAKLKKDKKERKALCTPEEWEKLKEERKGICKQRKEFKKEFKKEHKKMGKCGRHGGHPGYFGPHFGGHHGHPHHPPPPHHGHPHHPPFGHFGPLGADSDAEKLSARFAKDVTIGDGTEIAGGASFVKTWRIRNEGGAWPAGCVLRLLTKHSDSMGSPETVPVLNEGAVVCTGQEFDVSVPLIAPAKPGRYTAYYKMCTPAGKKFGQRVWVSIVVPSNSSSSSEGEKEADKYEGLVDTVLAMGFTAKRHRVFRLLQKCDGDVEKVTQILHVKTQHKAMKEHMKAQKKAAKNQL